MSTTQVARRRSSPRRERILADQGDLKSVDRVDPRASTLTRISSKRHRPSCSFRRRIDKENFAVRLSCPVAEEMTRSTRGGQPRRGIDRRTSRARRRCIAAERPPVAAASPSKRRRSRRNPARRSVLPRKPGAHAEHPAVSTQARRAVAAHVARPRELVFVSRLLVVAVLAAAGEHHATPFAERGAGRANGAKKKSRPG